MRTFKVFKGEKANELLKYSYKWLRRVDSFDEFEVWATDSQNVPSDRIITEKELEQLRKQREVVM